MRCCGREALAPMTMGGKRWDADYRADGQNGGDTDRPSVHTCAHSKEEEKWKDSIQAGTSPAG